MLCPWITVSTIAVSSAHIICPRTRDKESSKVEKRRQFHRVEEEDRRGGEVCKKGSMT